MNPYSIPTLISFLFTLFLASFVLYQGYRQLANKAFALAISSLSVMEFGNFMILQSLSTQRLLFWGRISLIGCCLIPANWSLFSVFFARSHEAISKRFKLLLIIIYFSSFLFLILIPFDSFISVSNSALYGKNVYLLGKVGRFFCVFLLLAIVFILFNLETVYRNSTGIKKWQIKYSILGMFAAFTFYIYVISRVILFQVAKPTYIPIGSVVILISLGILTFSFIRHRLMNIDVFVSRQVFYGSFTLIVISSYLILVGFIGQLLKILSIDFNLVFYPILVLFSLLILSVFFLSTTSRKVVTRFIDRHFYKNRYDYRFEWIELTNIISSAIDLNDLLKKFMELTAETMCVDDITVWLYDGDDKKYHLAGVRDVSEPEGPIYIDRPLTRYLEEKAEPFPIDFEISDSRLREIFNTNKAFFDKYSVSVMSPLIVKADLVGFITLGREITGAVYNYEDYDMLKILCHQAANAILNIKLSDRLVLAGEMELMNKISSFILHDLKNSISMLSLIVQNASYNMQDPEFQNDVLETISKTIKNMKGLISRISRVPKDIELNMTKTSIAKLLKDTILQTGLSKDGIQLIENYSDLPDVNLDREKIQSVFRNLIINAQELLKDHGTVSVSTYMENENIIIEVKDNGPGISKEFLKNKLFKPFQTTKKKGLGIGLYQSKTIIAAHNGKIEAESEVGKGTQFRIYLPFEKMGEKGNE
ncbi:MAG: XrtA/PEP-CTERM system histidine kinase PrsK [bacterium]